METLPAMKISESLKTAPLVTTTTTCPTSESARAAAQGAGEAREAGRMHVDVSRSGATGGLVATSRGRSTPAPDSCEEQIRPEPDPSM